MHGDFHVFIPLTLLPNSDANTQLLMYLFCDPTANYGDTITE